MQGADFIFFLQDGNRRFWGISEADDVVLSNAPYALKYSPDGWQDIVVKNVRNRKYWGIDRGVSLPFKYVEDGARILKHIFYNRGADESVFLVICEQRLAYDPGVSYGYWYKQIFRAEIDLPTFLHDGPVVTCNTLEDGIAKHLKANENTPYEFELDEYVKNDGINLAASLSFLAIEQLQTTNTPTYGYALLWPSFTYVGTDGTSPNVVGLSQTSEEWQSNTANDDNRFLTNYFLEASDAATVRLMGSITLQIDNAVNVKLYVRNSNGIRTTLIDFTPTAWGSPVPFTETATFDIDETFTLAAGEQLFLISSLTDSLAIAGQGSVIYSEFILKGETVARYATTYTAVTTPQTLFTEFINRMTGGEYTAETCPYFVTHANKKFTSGDAIRGVAGAKLKLSFAQFIEFFDVYDAVGIRESAKQVLFDRKAALTDNDNPINLGTANRLKAKLDKSFSFNEMAIGWPDIKSEQGMLNGKNEVNTTANFTFGTTKTPGKAQKASRIKTSCYDIETIRIEGANKDTTSKTQDNDPYVLHTTDTLIPVSGVIPAHYELNREYNTFVTGVDQISSVYNLALSPKNCLLNGSDWYRSCLYKHEGKTLKFLGSDRNEEMVYDDGTDQIIENADLPVSLMDDPFFTPVILEAEFDSLDDLLDSMETFPISSFEWEFEGETYKGILLENSVNPKTYKKQTMQFLSHPDNDLTKLIEYYG